MSNNNCFTPQEALEQFGLNWDIATRPVGWFTNPSFSYRGEFTKLPNKVIYRTDNETPLGIVSEKYHPLSNYSFADVIADTIRENDDESTRRVVAGGSYRNGKAVWLSVDLGNATIGGLDPIARQACFFTSHDGSGSLRMIATNTRIFCSNQFAQLDKTNSISIRHTSNMTVSIEAARNYLGGIASTHDTFTELAEDLAGKSVDFGWLAEFFRRSYLNSLAPDARKLLSTPVTRDMPLDVVARRERAEARLESHIELMANNYQQGTTSVHDLDRAAASNHMPADFIGSKWHAFNAYTHYIDHDRKGSSAESIHLGKAAQLKNDALKLASIL